MNVSNKFETNPLSGLSGNAWKPQTVMDKRKFVPMTPSNTVDGGQMWTSLPEAGISSRDT